MSLYCGKIGRTLVRHSVSNTATGKILGKTANAIGRIFSICTLGHYKIGLTRKAFELSQQLNMGTTINFQDGKITDETSSIIYEDQLLKIDQDMGEVVVRQPMTTPEGMARFLRYVYFRPRQWGITISDAFSDQERADIRATLDRINSILGIKLDNGIALNIAPTTFKNVLPIGLFCGLPAAFISFMFFAFGSTVMWKTGPLPISVLFETLAQLAIGNVAIFGTLSGFGAWKAANYFPCLHPPSLFPTRNGSIYFRRSTLFAHEYIHFLKDFGFISTDIVANTFYIFEELRVHGRLNTKEDQEDYEYGKKTGPSIFISHASLETRYWGQEVGYQTGSQLAGLADQLVERSGDPEIKNRFLRIVANSETREKLIQALQEDPKLHSFFDPSLELLYSLKD